MSNQSSPGAGSTSQPASEGHDAKFAKLLKDIDEAIVSGDLTVQHWRWLSRGFGRRTSHGRTRKALDSAREDDQSSNPSPQNEQVSSSISPIIPLSHEVGHVSSNPEDAEIDTNPSDQSASEVANRSSDPQPESHGSSRGSQDDADSTRRIEDQTHQVGSSQNDSPQSPEIPGSTDAASQSRSSSEGSPDSLLRAELLALTQSNPFPPDGEYHHVATNQPHGHAPNSDENTPDQTPTPNTFRQHESTGDYHASSSSAGGESQSIITNDAPSHAHDAGEGPTSQLLTDEAINNYQAPSPFLSPSPPLRGDTPPPATAPHPAPINTSKNSQPNKDPLPPVIEDSEDEKKKHRRENRDGTA